MVLSSRIFEIAAKTSLGARIDGSEKSIKIIGIALVVGLAWAIYSYRIKDKTPQTFSFRGETMGTTFEVKVVVESLSDARKK